MLPYVPSSRTAPAGRDRQGRRGIGFAVAHVTAVLALVAVLHAPSAPPRASWFGADKVKHFFVSAFVQSAAFAAARWSGADRATSHAAAGIATVTVGVMKEMRDRRAGGRFSVPDLAWGAAGGAAAAALLNHTR